MAGLPLSVFEHYPARTEIRGERLLGKAGRVLVGAVVLAATLAASAPARERAEFEPGTLLVRFEAGASRADVLDRRGLRSVGRVPRLGLVVVAGAADPAAAARSLERDPAVRYAEPNYLRRAAAAPDDPLYRKGRQGYIDTLRLPAAWDLAKAAAGQRVAVLDTGVDADHPGLTGAVLAGRDFVNGDDGADDDEGHGTSVAGVAVARTDDGLGTAGVSWAGRVVPVKVLDAEGEGYDDDIAAGIAWAADQGVDAINLSLGGPGASEALDDAVAYARARGAIVVAAAGNDAASEPHYPAASPGVLAVAASDWSGNAAWFTNHGEWVDLTAPGHDILAPALSGAHEPISGTSFSAPLVSGVALLLAAQHPEWTGDQIAARLTATALDVGPGGHDPYHGAGLVDPVAALGGSAAPATVAPLADLNGSPDRATTVTAGTRVRDAISVQGDEDWFAIDVTTPSLFSLTLYPDAERVSGRAEAFDAVIDVFNPTMQRIAHVDDNGNDVPETDSDVGMTDPGRYFLRVINANPSRSVGGYELGAFRLGTPNPPERFERHVIYRVDDVAAEQGGDLAKSVALGDVTGDGVVDTLVTAEGDTEENDDKLWVFAGNAGGTLEPPVELLAPSTSETLGLVVADLDGDGAKDAAVAGGGSLLLFYQREGRLTAARPLAAGGHAQFIEAADVDADGRMDLVASLRGDTASSGVMWYRNTGPGFERRRLASGFPRDVAVGDVNGDGRLDVVSANDSYLGVLRQAADHTFAEEQVVAARPREVEVADVTGDGRADVVSSNDRAGGEPSYTMTFFAQTAAGALGAPQVFDENSIYYTGLDVGDIDGDGRVDAAAMSEGGLWAEIYLQRTTGGLGPGDGRNVPQGYTRANGLRIGDVNGDGAADISYANDNQGLVVRRALTAGWPLPHWVRGTTPDDGMRGVSSGVVPELRLARDVAPGSVTAATVRLERDGATVPATPSYSARTLRVQPAASLASGDYVLRVSGVRDTRGNVLEWVLRFTVGTGGDGTAPDTVIRSAPSGTVKSQSPEIWSYATEAGATLQCALDGASFASCAEGVEYSAIAPGSHTFRVRAIDAAGNVDLTPAMRTWTGNEQIPAPANDSFGSPTTLAGASGSVTASTTAATQDGVCGPITRDSPGAQSIWYRWIAPGDGWVEFDTANSSFDTLLGVFRFLCREENRLAESDDAPGRSTSRARVQVRAGVEYLVAVDGHSYEGVNAENGNVALAWSFEPSADTAPPETTISSGPGAVSRTRSAAWTFESSEPGSTFECQFNSATDWQPCATPYRGFPLNGSQSLRVRAVDPAGNADPTPATWLWRSDWLPPQTTIASGPPGIVSVTTATLTFAADPDETSPVAYECRLDGGAWSACTSPRSYSGLAEGAHRFEVRGTDDAGNVEPEPAVRAWLVDLGGGDRRAPQTLMTAWPPEVSTSTSARFEFVSDEPDGGRFECRLDLGDWLACSSPHVYEGLGAGEHRVSVRAIDAAGNIDFEPPEHVWRIETALTTAITDEPPGLSASDTATFAFTSSDPAATFECRLDDGDWAGCLSPKTYTGLADGEHTFSARAVRGGNPDPAPPSRTWRIDTTPPVTTLSATTGGADATFTFVSDRGATFACRLDHGAWLPCASPAVYTALAAGAHTFSVRATDAAGNLEPVPAEHAWKVTSPPLGSDPAPLVAPELGLALRRTPTLRAALRRGLSVRASCSSACRLDLRLTVARSTARKLGLRRTILARAGHELAGAGQATVTLRFTKRVRRALQDERRLRASLELRARSDAGAATPVVKRLRL